MFDLPCLESTFFDSFSVVVLLSHWIHLQHWVFSYSSLLAGVVLCHRQSKCGKQFFLSLCIVWHSPKFLHRYFSVMLQCFQKIKCIPNCIGIAKGAVVIEATTLPCFAPRCRRGFRRWRLRRMVQWAGCFSARIQLGAKCSVSDLPATVSLPALSGVHQAPQFRGVADKQQAFTASPVEGCLPLFSFRESAPSRFVTTKSDPAEASLKGQGVRHLIEG